MVKATLNIPLGKERYKMIRKINKRSWNNSQNIEKSKTIALENKQIGKDLT